MKNETLIKRYKNLGYKPNGLEMYLEVENIIKWLYDSFNIYIDVSYINLKYNKDDSQYKFVGCLITNIDTELSNTFYTHKRFNNPYDAKLYTLIYFYRAIKFNFIR